MAIYEYKVRDAKGRSVPMAEYRGKVLLIVNTATGCGFTPQYEGLQTLYEKYAAEGFEVLDFPCNQFANQAPGDVEDIISFCRSKYHTTFQQFDKVDVNGRNATPLFSFLKKERGGMLGSDIHEERSGVRDAEPPAAVAYARTDNDAVLNPAFHVLSSLRSRRF